MKRVIFLLILFFALGSAERVLACSCLEERPVCEAFGNAKAVFVGEVMEGTRPEKMSELFTMGGGNRPFVLKVRETFLGISVDKEIAIYTGSGFGDCGFPFQKGEIYLIYAYERDGRLETSICTRSAHISKVEKEEFLNLKSLRTSPVGARLFGKVELYAKSSFEENHIQPMKNLKLLIESKIDKRKIFQIYTDKNGEYEIIGLPAGKYKIIPSVPKYLTTSDFDQYEEFEINETGCVREDFLFQNDSLIFVKVIDADKNPVKNIWVEFVPVGIEPNTNFSNYDEFGVTNPEGGLYNFNIAPGKYTISVNYYSLPNPEHPYLGTFYGNVNDRSKANVIEVDWGTQIKDIIIQLPRALELKPVYGRIVRPDGTPDGDVFVDLRDVETKRVISRIITRGDGKFVLKGFPNRKYIIDAFKHENVDGQLVEFKAQNVEFLLDDKTIEFSLVLERVKE